MDALTLIQERIVSCERCPRLRSYCESVAAKKKREFREWEYWGRPVPGFGDREARLWIVGLAPAAHGGNRTGRMFTGDSSGNWLYAALHRHRFANQSEAVSRHDGLELSDVFISAAARCAPPDNKPNRDELSLCESYLDEEWQNLPRVQTIVALGQIAFDTTLRLMRRQGMEVPKGLRFGHGSRYSLGNRELLASYHPSRQNTQTGRLTLEMWDSIFARVRASLGDSL